MLIRALVDVWTSDEAQPERVRLASFLRTSATNPVVACCFLRRSVTASLVANTLIYKYLRLIPVSREGLRGYQSTMSLHSFGYSGAVSCLTLSSAFTKSIEI